MNERFRVVFEMIDPRQPEKGWQEITRETDDLNDARDQVFGIRELEREGEDIRNPRIERTTVSWEACE